MNTSDAFAVIDHAPRSDDQDLLDRLADDLRAVGYRHDAVTGLLGDAAHDALGRDQLVPALLVVQGLLERGDGGSLAYAVGLWLLGMSFDAGQLDGSFPRAGHAGLLRLGLIEPEDGLFRAAVDVRPHASDVDAELWVASDLGAHQRPGVLRHDHVLGIGNASLTLAQAVIRRPVEHALDLGTGCGIQAFHLLSHCRRIVATDISARALAFTRFNLLLNHEALGLDPRQLEDRVQLRLGSLLEPVADEQFDLVVSNPPFVITPRHAGERAEEQFTYRDGGMPADSLVESLVRGLPEVLAPGGTAQLLANWEIREADADHDATGTGTVDESPDDKSTMTWGRRPKSWIAPDHDAWLILRDQTEPELYAETWLRDASQGRDRDAYATAYRDYLADFASRDVSGIGFGLLWLRRPVLPGGPTFGIRFEEIVHAIEQPIAPHLAAQIAATDALAGQEAAGLVLTVAEDVTEERHQRPGAPHPGVILLRQGAGLRRTTLLSSAEAGFVSACDGEYSAGVLAQAVASLVEGDPQETTANLLASVGRLVTQGFLTEMRNKG
ncbi:methyltransferase [Arthrobacter sp. JSM 101049]|uniref:DUF7059 domain-containing protein n=1 Tax=Arthrobacter sp. JSM 101049 TaxID=929097 RepID=UPI00356A7089